MDEWHSVLVERSLNSARLTVDGAVTEYVGSGSVGLTVNSPLYIGGVPDSSLLHSEVEFFSGFKGCMENLQVMSKKKIVDAVTKILT